MCILLYFTVPLTFSIATVFKQMMVNSLHQKKSEVFCQGLKLFGSCGQKRLKRWVKTQAEILANMSHIMIVIWHCKKCPLF